MHVRTHQSIYLSTTFPSVRVYLRPTDQFKRPSCRETDREKKKEEKERNKQTKTGLSSHGPVLVHERVELDVLWRQAGQQGVEDAEGVGSSPTVHQEPLVQAKHPKVR